MKKIIELLTLIILIFAMTACSGSTVASSGVAAVEQAESIIQTVVDEAQSETVQHTAVSVEYDADDLNVETSGTGATSILLNGDTISVEGKGATVNGSSVTITSGGEYSISGTLNDGQIIVDTVDQENVVLILSGASITSLSSAPIYIKAAEKTVITLAEGTENTVNDATTYVYEDPSSDEPNAAIFSKDDLTINGSGSLTVNANYNNGIQSKDDLKITGGNITVNAVNDGIKGRDSIAMKDGTITISAGGDGMQSNNDEDVEKGYVSIEGGTLNITAGMDGIQAETNLLVSGGELTISTGGGSDHAPETDDSAKGLKAGVDLTITGGTISIDASDDAVHSNDSMTIDGGELLLASGDDGMHADSSLTINGGTVTITKSYEGIESKVITLNNGDVSVVASDDGVNGSSGSSSTTVNGGPGQQNPFIETNDAMMYINGGTLVVNAGGDGIDVNSPLAMSGGMVIVNGPTNDGNGALDYTGSFEVSGGFMVAAGSAGMAQAPSESSTQYSVIIYFPSQQTAGTLVHIAGENGEDILTFAPAKTYQSVMVTSPELAYGATYTVYTGGSASGTATNGLYTDGTYTPGEEFTSFTILGATTTAGSYSGGRQGGGGRPGGGGGRPPAQP